MIYLFITILGDVLGIGLLGKAKGFSEPWYLAGGLLCMAIGFVAFSFATKTMSVGFANAAWSGMSLILVVAVGRLFFDEQLTMMQYVCMLLILVGVVGLQVMEKA